MSATSAFAVPVPEHVQQRKPDAPAPVPLHSEQNAAEASVGDLEGARTATSAVNSALGRENYLGALVRVRTGGVQ